MDRNNTLYNTMENTSPLGQGFYLGNNRKHSFTKPHSHNQPYGYGRGGFYDCNRGNTEGTDFIPLGSSTPVHITGRSPKNMWNKQGRGRQSFGSNNSTNSSGSRGVSPAFSPYTRGAFRYKKRGGFTNPGHEPDISLYYHPSMVEDPWAKLEEQARLVRLSRSDSEVSSTGTQISVLAGSLNSLSDSDEASSSSPPHDSQEQYSAGSSSEGSS